MNANKGTKGFFKVDIVERFLSKTNIPENKQECWIWTGANDGKGYGQIWHNGKNRKATKVSWELYNKKAFPDGKEACHSCDNPRCVNPEHIWPGTHKENMIDSAQKGRITGVNRKPLRKKTHCKRGHEFSQENTYVRKDGTRECLSCKKIHEAKRRALPTVKLEDLK